MNITRKGDIKPPFHLEKASVKTSNIADGSVTLAKLADDALHPTGIDESGSGTITTFTITIEKGIITAFSKLS